MSIYTKSGDRGRTSILRKKGGKIVVLSKASFLIDAIGSVDEANSYLGIILSELKIQNLKFKNKIQNSKIKKVQKNLFTIGSILAGADISLKDMKVEELEKEIDIMENKLPVLTGFILPGGSLISAQLMYARALVRKAERMVVRLVDRDKNSNYIKIIPYLNRLSDYLFVLGRWVNFKNNEKEVMRI